MSNTKWIIVFGIILMVAGLVLSLYTETDEILGEVIREEQPYQEVGLVLLFGGIISIIVGGVQMSKISKNGTDSS